MAKVIKAFKFLFSQSKKSAQEKIAYVGKDHLGNKYYEKYRPSDWRVHRRYFEREKLNEDEYFSDLSRVPPAWDAWLRYRRQQPPSPDEVAESENYFKVQQDLAARKKEEGIITSREMPQPDKFPKRREFSLRAHMDPDSLKYKDTQ